MSAASGEPANGIGRGEKAMGKVKKIINEVAELVPETLEGLVLASHGRLRPIADRGGHLFEPISRTIKSLS
jgi:hypothetical protein